MKKLRMNSPARVLAARLAAISTASTVLMPGFASAPAHAEGSTEPTEPAAVADYICTVADAPESQVVTLTLTVTKAPDSVKAGDVLLLDGRLTMTFSDVVAVTSRAALASTASTGASELTFGTKVGKAVGTLAPVLAADDAAPIKKPFLLGSGITTPAINVPTDARGSIELYLPFADDGNPAFTTTIVQNSLLRPTRKVSCANEPNAEPVRLARIPIRGTTIPADSSTGGSGKSGKSGKPGEPGEPGETAGSAPLSGTPGGAIPPASSEPVGAAASAPEAAGVAGGSIAAEATPSSIALQNAEIPEATARRGTFLPLWTLAIMGAVLPAGAIALALRQRALLTRARSQLDTGGDADAQTTDEANVGASRA